MARSFRKTEKCGNCGRSEKAAKRNANRALRLRARMALQEALKDDVADVILPLMDEILTEWDMPKDGKTFFGHDARDPNPAVRNNYLLLMRK